jgi:hypothetical protein
VTVFFPILLILACILSIPAYSLSKRRGTESKWILFLSGPALVVWFFLTATGYGAQSLSNIVEVIWLIGAGIFLSYAKVIIIDKRIHKPVVTTYVLVVILVICALLLRSFMPSIPE